MKTLTLGLALVCLSLPIVCLNICCASGQQLESQSGLRSIVIPINNGFAHNDYLHKHPLSDALENGFTNIEADIFLINGKLVVAHIFPYFKGHRTLESLYLRPLSERIAKNNGNVFLGYNNQVTLLIDIKTGADKTYEALKPLLEKYRAMLTSYENGKITYGAVTIVLSGHKPYELIRNARSRLAFIDADLRKVPFDSVGNNVFTMASCKYSKLIKWNGNDTISKGERAKILAYVVMAHQMGARVRLWALPEKRAVWNELLACGVDLINTDQLVNLKNYLTGQSTAKVDR